MSVKRVEIADEADPVLARALAERDERAAAHGCPQSRVVLMPTMRIDAVSDERARIVEIVKVRARRARDRGDLSVEGELLALANEIGAGA